MASTKTPKLLTYKDKPIYRKGNVIYYGDLSQDLILVLEIAETEEVNGIPVSKKVKFHIQDNTGELGKGVNYRSGERENLYKAFDIGAWWLKDALQE
ncbi:MAG: hypothetical protein E7417_03410 [Ruminococcaceae bacterium]|nr:hypothetical protein [Oscillospiraceae bacterium]